MMKAYRTEIERKSRCLAQRKLGTEWQTNV